MSGSSVSFVIPTLNRRHELTRLLDSIRKQDRQDFEVIVVDNGSTDDTLSYLESLGGALRVIRNATNLGAAEAKNQGIVASRAPLVWFLDSDTELHDGEVVSRALELANRHPDIGLLGGEMTLDGEGRMLCHVKRFRPNGETESSVRPAPVKLEPCDYLPTCNCLARRELLECWGGFDPSYFVLSEDDELGYAARRFDFEVRFDSRITVIHHISEGGRFNSLRLANRNRVRCSLHNRPMREVLLLPVAEVREMLRVDNLQLIMVQREKSFLDRYESGPLTELARAYPSLEPFAPIAFGLHYVTSLARAYAHHALRLPDVIRMRRHRPDFLDHLRREA